ncbi:MAG: hypothetical protein AAFY17_06725 [Cyanobacteria bacterium J06642_11]
MGYQICSIPGLGSISIAVYQPWFWLGSLYIGMAILGGQPGSRRWTPQERLWLWLSSWCMGLFGLGGLSYGLMIGTVFEVLAIAAVMGAVVVSLTMGLVLNGSYRVIVALLRSKNVALDVCIVSLMRGLVITAGLAMGVLLAGGTGLAIASLIHLLFLGYVDYCNGHRRR